MRIAMENRPPAKIVWALLLLSFCLLIITSYTGPHNFLYNFIHQSLMNPGLYKLDLYVNNSIVPQSSPYYDFLRFFDIDLMDDRIGFPVHLFYILIAGYFVYRILRDFFQHSPAQTVVVIMLILVFTNSELLRFAQPSWLSVRSGTATQVAQSITFAVVYYVLKRKHYIASLCLTATLIFSIKVGWILLPISLLALILDREASIKALVAYLIPLAYMVYKALESKTGYDAEALRVMTEAVFLRGREEDVVHLQGIIPLAAFTISVPMYYMLARSLHKGIERHLVMACLFVTTLVLILGGWYELQAYKYMPNPGIALLSPVRATSLYQFLFVLMAVLWIIDTDRLYGLEKSALLLFVVFFQVGGDTNLFLFVIIPLSCFGLTISVICRCNCKSTVINLCKINYLWVVLPLLALYSTALIVRKDINDVGYALYNSWTMPTYKDNDLWILMQKLRVEPEDKVVLILLEQTHCTTRTCGRPDKMLGLSKEYKSYSDYTVAVMPNVLARKSPYVGDFAHLLLNYNAYKEHVRRLHVVEAILKGLGHKPAEVDAVIRENLLRDNVYLLVPDVLAKYFPEWNIVRVQGRLRYMAPRQNDL